MHDSPPDNPPLSPASRDSVPLRAFETRRRLIVVRRTADGDEVWAAGLPEEYRHTRRGGKVRGASPEFAHHAATLYLLELSKERLHGLQRRATPLHCVSASEWQSMLTELVGEIAPETPMHGITILVRHAELFVYRDQSGQQDAVDLAERPDGVTNTRTIHEAEFSRITATFLKRRLPAGSGGNRRFLFRTGQPRSGADYVYINLDAPRLLYLNRRSEVMSPQISLLGAFDTVVIRSHLIALIKNPFTCAARLGTLVLTALSHLLQRRHSAALAIPQISITRKPLDLAAFRERLDRICRYPAYPARMQFHIDGKAYFPSLLDALAKARKQVLLRTYIFDNDDYAVKVGDALRRASKRGAEVRVLYDRMGSHIAWLVMPESELPRGFEFPAHMGTELRRDHSGVQVREGFNPWFTSDHTKVTVIDDHTAFLGGMNIGREYRYEWHDLMVELHGGIVGRLRKDCQQAWGHAGPLGDIAYATEHLFRGEHAPAVDDGILVRPLYTRTGVFEIFRAQREAIRRAQSRIFIANPYFTDKRLLAELAAARQRGVDIRVILPGTGNHPIMNASNAVTANTLMQAGIRVYTYPGMSHLKAAVYDGWACVGSANFDRLSLAVNQECNVGFDDPAAVEDLVARVFEADFACSKERIEPYPVGWGHHFMTAIAGWL